MTTDFDRWITTDPREHEQLLFERWVEDNEDALEGMSDTDIEVAYEDWISFEAPEQDYDDDYDMYPTDEYGDY